MKLGTEFLLVGQNLLKRGYKIITSQDVRKMLKCDEMETMENDLIKSEIVEIFDREFKNKKTFWGNPRYNIYQKHYLSIEDKWGRDLITRQYKTCNVKYEDLKTFVKEIIPDEILNNVNTLHDMGISEFCIAYPVIEERKQPDPIVLGKINEEDYVFVGQFE